MRFAVVCVKSGGFVYNVKPLGARERGRRFIPCYTSRQECERKNPWMRGHNKGAYGVVKTSLRKIRLAERELNSESL